jgi:beta-glucosidase
MYEANGTRPAYPFGHGLGYTTIEWGEPEVVAVEWGKHLSVKVRLTNVGSRPGSEVVQGYVAQALGTDRRPLRTLRAFQKVALRPGTSTDVVLEMPLGEGETGVWIGPSSDPAVLRAVPVARH